MRFEENFPDQLKSQVKLSDIIARKISIKSQSSDKYLALCPFHNEKTPSFHIDDQKEFYHCFGCGAHGNIFNFIMETENLPFFEAVIKIANDFNIPVPYIKNKEIKPEEKKNRDRSFEIHEIICQFFENNLYNQNNELALQYIYSRSLDKNIIKKFRLGFAEKNPEKLLQLLKDQQFSEKEILDSGVFSKGENNIYCRFRNRIIFPITNNKNQIIAYGGRVMDESLPKYLNSPETKLFQKRQNLYNFSNAKKEIYKKEYAILVEGYMDVISLDNYKINNAVAPLGTAVTLDQLNILFRVTNNVVICLDGDQAGIRGAKRIIDLVLPIINANNNIRFAFLPDKMDPDDFIKSNGQKEMLQFLENSKNLSDILFQFELENLNINNSSNNISPEKKTILENNLRKKTDLIQDNNSKRNFVQYYNNLLFFLGSKRKHKENNRSIKDSKLNFNINSDSSLTLGLKILNIIINFPDLLRYQDDDLNISEIHFNNDILENIKEEIFDNIINEELYRDKIQDFIIDNVIENKDFIIKQIFAKDDICDKELVILQIKIFYLKILHKNLESEYKDHLQKKQEIEDSDFSKSQNLFNYKSKVERKILELEKRFNI
jgi:DNA primase